MRALVGCEYSGRTRHALRNLGVDAWSCDLLPSDDNSPYHHQGDVLALLSEGWDFAIFHPPCTHLAVSGAAHFARKRASGEQQSALDFVRTLMACKFPWALENPVSIISTAIRKPNQIIHPWQFGHPEQKTTCLWLHDLPPLVPTKNVREEMLALPKHQRERLHYLSPGPDRWKERSRTFLGIAQAMAEQWTSAVSAKAEAA